MKRHVYRRNTLSPPFHLCFVVERLVVLLSLWQRVSENDTVMRLTVWIRQARPYSSLFFATIAGVRAGARKRFINANAVKLRGCSLLTWHLPGIVQMCSFVAESYESLWQA